MPLLQMISKKRGEREKVSVPWIFSNLFGSLLLYNLCSSRLPYCYQMRHNFRLLRHIHRVATVHAHPYVLLLCRNPNNPFCGLIRAHYRSLLHAYPSSKLGFVRATSEFNVVHSIFTALEVCRGCYQRNVYRISPMSQGIAMT